ncbi:MAG: SGNH/GDSL hydrolase family protein [Candidatus Chisholmbacteria bacterium]|nr:SGNH/GDSL hydrolase family protein [Candidatus Chisholmbacteria bacterium]
MVDTMGTGLPYLEKALKNNYPATNFFLLNFGVGSTNIDDGLARLSQPFNYQNRSYPPLLQAEVDAVIIESFAYNPLPLSEANLAHHRFQLEKMVRQVQSQTSAPVLLMATIAPHHELFGTGPGGVNWEGGAVAEHTQAIHAYLENTINTGNALGIPVIDVFHPSQDSEGNGQLRLISPHDHIHPSAAGQNFIAQTIAQTLVSLKLLE